MSLFNTLIKGAVLPFIFVLAGCNGDDDADAQQQAPTVTTQPADVTVTEPMMATFTAAATGDPAPAYQWERSSDGNSWSPINGATDASYTTPATSAIADNGSFFRVVATNTVGSATSNAALLTVNAQASGAWQAPESIAATSVNFEPSIGFRGDGQAYAVWNSGSTNSQTNFSIRSDTGVWSAPLRIDQGFAPGFGARIAVAPDGRAVAVWTRSSTSASTIVASRYDGSAWSTPVTVSTAAVSFSANPSVAIDDNARAVVVWYANDVSVNRYRAFASSSISDNTWSSPLALDGYDASTPQVAVNGQGKGFAIFPERNVSQQSSLQAVPIDLATVGIFGAKQELRPFGRGIGQRGVSIDGNGAAMAVWLDDTGAGDNLRWSRYTPSGGWTAPADLALSVGFQPDRNLALSSADSGDVVVAWVQFVTDGGTSDEAVLTRRFSSTSGTWAAQERRSSNVVGVRDNSENPRVAISTSGRVAVTWMQYNGDVYRVWGQVFEGDWRPAQSLMTANEVENDAVHALAMSADGMPLEVWAEIGSTANPLNGAVWR